MNTNFETASRTCGSCSHRFKASTLLVFLCGLGSRNIASAHKIPEFGHSCNAGNTLMSINNKQ